MNVLKVAAEIVLPDPRWERAARARLDCLTKPLGSLGQLEDVAAQMTGIFGGERSSELRPAVYVFAADHGVTAAGVSAYPGEVTRQMVANFLAGGAAVSVLARMHEVALRVIDVGVDSEFGPTDGLVDAKVRRGSRNMLEQPAMNEAELYAALEVGFRMADGAQAEGRRLLAVGEMGIGNTTAASALTAALIGCAATSVTGRGTGVGDREFECKCRVVAAAVARHCGEGDAEALRTLQCVGGLEIAAMTGFYLRGAWHGMALVCDGFISTAAAAVAVRMAPAVKAYLIAGHCSEEPGHQVLLDAIGIRPLLQLGMRLGEGMGAVLAIPLIRSALALYAEMATFDAAGVSEAAV